MSRLPGHTNANPFSSSPPPRTPGLMGVKDGTAPDGNTVGDTPGTVGVNDGAATRALPGHLTYTSNANRFWIRFLDATVNWKTVSGPKLAWKSPDHHQMTNGAMDPLWLDMMPSPDVRRHLLYVLSSLPMGVVDADITPEQFSDSHLRGLTAESGQASHFMAFKGQSQEGAYAMGMEKVFGGVEAAIKHFRNHPDRSHYDDVDDLAESIHALQDSFSPAHVQRRKEGDRWKIVRMFVWQEQRPEDHDAGDKSGRIRADGRVSDLWRAACDATLMLLRYYVLMIVYKDAEAARQKKELVEKFLTPADRAISGWGPM